MRSTLRAALAAALLLGITATKAPETTTDHRANVIYASSEQKANGPCDEERWMRITPAEWSPELVRGLIRCAVARWPVAGGAPKAIAVGQCESSLYPWAVGGSNYGVFQHRSTYWIGRVHTYLRARWFNARQWSRLTTTVRGAFIARANVLVSILMVHRGGWGPWSCS